MIRNLLSQQHTEGRSEAQPGAVLHTLVTAATRLRSRKEINRATKEWPAFVAKLPVCAAEGRALLETDSPLSLASSFQTDSPHISSAYISY